MIHQILRYTCDSCGKVEEQTEEISYYCNLQYPILPVGWIRDKVHGLICDEHDIVVTITKRASA